MATNIKHIFNQKHSIFYRKFATLFNNPLILPDNANQGGNMEASYAFLSNPYKNTAWKDSCYARLRCNCNRTYPFFEQNLYD